MGGRKKFYKDMDEILSHPTVQKWLDGVKAGPSRTTDKYIFARFVRWRKSKGYPSDPDALIEDCLEGNNRTLRDHAVILEEYCGSDSISPSNKQSTRLKHERTIRSFYDANKVPPLPKTTIRFSSPTEDAEVENETAANQFLEMFGSVLRYGGLSVMNRSIMLVALQSAMDDSTLARVFNFVAYPQLVTHFGTENWRKWDLRKCPVRIRLVRPKNSKKNPGNHPYYTFLDVDAVAGLQGWLSMRNDITGEPIQILAETNPKKLQRSEPIYITKHQDSISPSFVSLLFREAGKTAGVNVEPDSKPGLFRGAERRYPFHSHECRDTLLTLAKRKDIRADPVAANYFAGHSIDKLNYDKSPLNDLEYYREQYLRIARPHLNLVSGETLRVHQEYGKRLRKSQAALREFSRLKEEIAQLKKAVFPNG
jgi:hypothetical protein